MTNAAQNYLLGIESSANTCAAGISENHRLLVEISAGIKHIHSEKLAGFVEDVLSTTELSAGDLSGLVISAGPGSFTGLRIGYSLVKGLAHAYQLPVIEVPTLDVLAFQTGFSEKPILPVIDAHRGEIFTAIYRNSTAGFQRLTGFNLIHIERLNEFVTQPVLVVGGDALRLQEPISAILKNRVQFGEPAYPEIKIEALLQLGYRKFQQKEFSDVILCEPMYMREFKGVS